MRWRRRARSTAPPRRRAAWAAARHSGRHQGHLRHRRLSDRMRLARAQGPAADAAIATAVARLRAAGAVIIGKTVTTEFAYFHAGADPQSARSRTHARRLVVRLGRGGRRRHGAARDRLADQRLGDPPGGVLRRLWRQADATARSRGTARSSCRRALDHVGVFARSLADTRADARRARRLRRGRPRHAAAGGAEFRETLAENAAVAAAPRLRAHAGLGQGRCRRRARRSRHLAKRLGDCSRGRRSAGRFCARPGTIIASSWRPIWRTISARWSTRGGEASSKQLRDLIAEGGQ